MANYSQGVYKPINSEKYVGNQHNIQYRSSWEYTFMLHLDKSDKVIRWGSEEMYIKYYCQIRNEYHRYYPDFFVDVETKNGNKKLIIEIKPFNQCHKPKSDKRNVDKMKTYIVNISKWHAAIEYCKSYGFEFVIIHEKNVNTFIKNFLV